MDFYHAPTSCSQAAHILLHEAGLPFRPHKVDIFAGKVEDGRDYATVNPNGYVPALVLDGGMLITENVALLDWIARQNSELAPSGEMARTRHLQLLAFISTELHKPFVRLFFTESEDEKQYLADALARRFAWLASQLDGDFLAGSRFSAVDAFAYVMIRWASMTGVGVPAELRNLAASAEQRASVRRVLEAEAVEPLVTTGVEAGGVSAGL